MTAFSSLNLSCLHADSAFAKVPPSSFCLVHEIGATSVHIGSRSTMLRLLLVHFNFCLRWWVEQARYGWDALLIPVGRNVLRNLHLIRDGLHDELTTTLSLAVSRSQLPLLHFPFSSFLNTCNLSTISIVVVVGSSKPSSCSRWQPSIFSLFSDLSRKRSPQWKKLLLTKRNQHIKVTSHEKKVEIIDFRRK